MTLLKLRQLLNKTSIDDVFLSGFVDKGERSLQFYPSLSAYFLECKGILLRFGAQGYSGKALVSDIGNIVCDLDLDDGMEFAIMSVKQILLRAPDDENCVSKVTLWSPEEVSSGVECSAMRIELANGQVLFFDPSYHFGVRVGGVEQQSIWFENKTQSTCFGIDI